MCILQTVSWDKHLVGLLDLNVTDMLHFHLLFSICQILASTNARRLVVMDVETGEQIVSYDNCKCHAVSFFIFPLICTIPPTNYPKTAALLLFKKQNLGKCFLFYPKCFSYCQYLKFFLSGVYNGPDRTGLAVDIQAGPNIAACCCVNGRGLSIFDLRMPLPLDFIYDVSYSLARITFLDDERKAQNFVKHRMNGQELLSAVGWKSIPVMTPASCRGKSWTVFPICRH